MRVVTGTLIHTGLTGKPETWNFVLPTTYQRGSLMEVLENNELVHLMSATHVLIRCQFT